MAAKPDRDSLKREKQWVDRSLHDLEKEIDKKQGQRTDEQLERRDRLKEQQKKVDEGLKK